MRSFFAAFPLVLLAFNCFAQPNVKPLDSLEVSQQLTIIYPFDLQQLSPVEIVSEKRLNGVAAQFSGHNIEILKAKDIEKMPVQSLNEALSYISGVDLRQRGPNGAQADLSIMGSTFEQVLILVNGIPMRDPQTGHNQLNLPFDLSMVQEIQVIKGSAARIYGANAMAGAINIITKRPGTQKGYFQAYTSSPFQTDTASGDTYYGLVTRGGIGFHTKTTGHQIDVGFQKTNGYRYNSSNEQRRINYMGTWSGKKSFLDWMAGTVYNEFGANGFYSPRVDKNAVEKVSTSFGSVKFSHYSNNWKFSPLAYVRYNHDDYNLNAFNYQNNHFTTTAGAELHVTRKVKSWQIGGGYESRAEIIRSNNLGKYERYYHALYADTRHNFSNNSNITFGVNGQYNTDFGWKIYPGIEYFTSIKGKLSGFGNVGLANRLPTYTDLYYSDSGNIGNANLKPESAFNIEAGLRLRNNSKWEINGSAFVRDVTNFIDFVRANENEKYQPQNFQHVQVRGGEIDLKTSFESTSNRFFNPSQAKLSYTYLDATLLNDNQDSKYALQHLRHQIIGSFAFKLGEHLSTSINGRYVERFRSQEYALLDLRLKYAFEHWNIMADVTNILDRDYIESGVVPMPGRWFRIGFDYHIN